MLACLCLIVASCGERKAVVKKGDFHHMNNYESIDAAIDLLCEGGNWSEEMYQNVLDSIIVSASNSLIDKDRLQDYDLKNKLFSLSCKYVFDRVDAAYRGPSINDKDELTRSKSFLQKQTGILKEQGVAVGSNENLNEADNIIKNWGTVYGYASNTCSKRAVFFEDYSFDEAKVISQVEGNAYYQKGYYKANTELRALLNGLVDRKKKAHVSYLVELEKLIEQETVLRRMSLEDLLSYQKTFNGWCDAAGASAAKRALSEFVDGYNEPEDNTL